ncbi:MAG: DUF4440 domain-containing protein [Chitinophagaceae bacterium]|nr:DUF4440 domain-containing protein [Chitinophagaceae bacterium]
MKHTFIKLSGLALVTLLFGACNNETAKTETATFSLDSAKASIAASNNVFGASWATGDSVSFANCYTADACINPPNMPKMCGTAAISAFFNGGVKMGLKNIVLATEEVFGGKEAVIETGTYDMQVAGNVSVDKGKYIVMWKEVDGKWKMYRDVWNSDLPANPPPAK